MAFNIFGFRKDTTIDTSAVASTLMRRHYYHSTDADTLEMITAPDYFREALVSGVLDVDDLIECTTSQTAVGNRRKSSTANKDFGSVLLQVLPVDANGKVVVQSIASLARGDVEVAKSYVDAQDAATLASAKAYADSISGDYRVDFTATKGIWYEILSTGSSEGGAFEFTISPKRANNSGGSTQVFQYARGYNGLWRIDVITGSTFDDAETRPQVVVDGAKVYVGLSTNTAATARVIVAMRVLTPISFVFGRLIESATQPVGELVDFKLTKDMGKKRLTGLLDGTTATDAVTKAQMEAANPITTQGDLVVGDAAGVSVRLPVGTAGQVLTSDGSAAAWTTPAPIVTAGTVFGSVDQQSGWGTNIDVPLTGMTSVSVPMVISIKAYFARWGSFLETDYLFTWTGSYKEWTLNEYGSPQPAVMVRVENCTLTSLLVSAITHTDTEATYGWAVSLKSL